MPILLIVLIVSICGFSHRTQGSKISCYHCGYNFDESSAVNFTPPLEECVDENSLNEIKHCISSHAVDVDEQTQIICFWSRVQGEEVRTCGDRVSCLQAQQQYGTEKIKCCETDLCNDNSFRPSRKEKKGGNSHSADSGGNRDSGIYSVAIRTSVNWKLVLLMLILSMITMYTHQ